MLYVHALVRTGPSRLVVCQRRLALVRAGQVGALVETARAAPEVSEASLRAQHALVVELATRIDPLLPVRFGCVLDRAELVRVLVARQVPILQALERVRGCRQMTVRIFGRAGATAPTPAKTGAEYLRARRAAARAAVLPIARAVQQAVQHLIEDERIDPAAGRLRVSLHHLVPVRSCAAYRRVLKALDPGPGAERLVLSGPWPPFAFGPEPWP